MVTFYGMEIKGEEQKTHVQMITLEFWKKRCKYHWSFHWDIHRKYAGVPEFKGQTILGYVGMGSLSQDDARGLLYYGRMIRLHYCITR